MNTIIIVLGVLAALLLGKSAGRAGLGGGKNTKLTYGIGFWVLLIMIILGFIKISFPKSLFLAIGLIVLTIIVWIVTASSRIGRTMDQSDKE